MCHHSPKTKTDKADAKGIALFIAEEGFQPDLPVSYHIQELKSLTRARFSFVQDRSALKNKVKRWSICYRSAEAVPFCRKACCLSHGCAGSAFKEKLQRAFWKSEGSISETVGKMLYRQPFSRKGDGAENAFGQD